MWWWGGLAALAAPGIHDGEEAGYASGMARPLAPARSIPRHRRLRDAAIVGGAGALLYGSALVTSSLHDGNPNEPLRRANNGLVVGSVGLLTAGAVLAVRGLLTPRPSLALRRHPDVLEGYTVDLGPLAIVPPSLAPHPPVGSFVQEQADGTWAPVASTCAPLLRYADEPVAPVRTQALVSLPSGAAGRLGVGHLPGAGPGAETYAGLGYVLTERRRIAGGREELAACCRAHPTQCTGRLVTEWWQGAGEVHEADPEKLRKALSRRLDVELKRGMGFRPVRRWLAPAYFAFVVEEVELPASAGPAR